MLAGIGSMPVRKSLAERPVTPKKVAVTAETSQVVQGLGDSYKPQVVDSAEAAKDAVRNGDADAAVTHLAAATRHDPEYSAAWKLLGKALLACGREIEAEAAWRAGLGAAARRGDVQSSKEMTVFLRRIARGRQAMS